MSAPEFVGILALSIVAILWIAAHVWTRDRPDDRRSRSAAAWREAAAQLGLRAERGGATAASGDPPTARPLRGRPLAASCPAPICRHDDLTRTDTEPMLSATGAVATSRLPRFVTTRESENNSMPTPANPARPTVSYRYHLRSANGGERKYTVTLDQETLELVLPARDAAPEWTRLGFNKCPNCTLDDRQSPACPAALAVADLVILFRDSISHEVVDVRVDGPERTYLKRVSMQDVAGALMGLLMATCGCPILGKLRPLAATHLPFPSFDEASYRFVTMHLLAQYFLVESGKLPGFDLKRLVDFYGKEISPVNSCFCRRLREARLGRGDANLNGVNILDAMGMIASASIEEESMKRWRGLFSAHLSV